MSKMITRRNTGIGKMGSIPLPKKKALSGKQILQQSELSKEIDVKELSRLGFGTRGFFTEDDGTPIIHNSLSNPDVFDACQKILGTLDGYGTSNQVKDIQDSFVGGDFAEKVIDFVENQDVVIRNFEEIQVGVCKDESCPRYNACSLHFMVNTRCVWQAIYTQANEVSGILMILHEVADYMKKVDDNFGDKFHF